MQTQRSVWLHSGCSVFAVYGLVVTVVYLQLCWCLFHSDDSSQHGSYLIINQSWVGSALRFSFRITAVEGLFSLVSRVDLNSSVES